MGKSKIARLRVTCKKRAARAGCRWNQSDEVHCRSHEDPQSVCRQQRVPGSHPTLTTVDGRGSTPQNLQLEGLVEANHWDATPTAWTAVLCRYPPNFHGGVAALMNAVPEAAAQSNAVSIPIHCGSPRQATTLPQLPKVASKVVRAAQIPTVWCLIITWYEVHQIYLR